MTEHLDVGEIIRITNGAGFQMKPSLELFDPDDVALTLQTPSFDVEDLSADVTRDEEGLYHADYQVSEEGRHWFRWNGDDIIEEGHFYVVHRRVPEPGS